MGRHRHPAHHATQRVIIVYPLGCPSGYHRCSSSFAVLPPSQGKGRQGPPFRYCAAGPCRPDLAVTSGIVTHPRIEPCQPHLVLSDSLKSVREALCLAQTALGAIAGWRYTSATETIQKLINEIDRQRPLGPDGKHDERHTETCGCERPGLHCAHWHLGAPCCRCSEPTRLAPVVEHAPEKAGPDGLGYGVCTACGEVWPCTAWRDRPA